ncbi:MAG: M20/M25/M40 family metallo-hydrolase [Candidatus Micrarchaeota archaeon]
MEKKVLGINMDVISLAKTLVSIDSQVPGPGEIEVSQFIFDYLKEIGLKPQKQFFDGKRFNVLAFGGSQPSLMVNVHLDTVPINDRKQWKRNPFGEIVNGKLYGRGSCDTKGHAACLLAALQNHINEDVVYIFNGEEEGSFAGIEKVLELRKTKLKSIQNSVSLEPTDGKLMIGNKGSYFIKVSATGKTSHSSRPELGDNAIYKISKAALAIEKYNKKLTKRKSSFGNASASVGMVDGGTATNVVPDSASMLVDRRVLPGENPKKVESEFREVVNPLSVDFIKRIEACSSSPNSKIVRQMQTILTGFDMDPKPYSFSATTELSEISKHGIEGIIFGTGELGQGHMPDEYITIDALNRGEKILLSLLKNWSR